MKQFLFSYSATTISEYRFFKARHPRYADGRIILRWIFRKWEGVVGTGWSWLGIGTGGGHL